MSVTVGVDCVGIVIPVHDEATHLPACLESVAAAARDSGIPTGVVIVFDACTDGSESVATDVCHDLHLEFFRVSVDARAVGAARRAGVFYLLRCVYPGKEPNRIWIANTDADSRVPVNWVRRQAQYAAEGAVLVAGTVDVDDWAQWPEDVRSLYLARYQRDDDPAGHGHVHGANLGIRADRYLAAGEFPPAAYDEDIALMQRAVDLGVQVTWAPDLAVLTSSRPHARAPLGFAGHLHDLNEFATSSQGLGRCH